MASETTLSSLLESILPKGLNLSVYHVHTPPEETDPLYLTPKGAKPTPTTLESHFLGLSLLPEGVFIYGIEILIYTATLPSPTGSKPLKESTFFVSKADSSGYLPRAFASFTPKPTGESTTPNKLSTLKEITSTFLSYLVSNHLAQNREVSKYTISLFARAQNQYLFPDSVSVPTKHILDDRGLIRWWCSVLDPLYQTFDSAKAYLLVPGLERNEVRSLLPPHSKYPAQYPDVKNKWTHGCPFVTDEKTSVREVIPHFPDDPKARFMDELEFEGVPDGAWEDDERIGQGWIMMKSVDMFWEFMSMRQECSLGRMVGFVWVVVDREGERKEVEEKEEDTAEAILENAAAISSATSVGAEETSSTESKDTSAPSATEPSTTKQTKPDITSEFQTPTPSNGESLITSDAFTSLYDLLTDDKKTDFMNLSLAVKSTKNWIKKVYSFSQNPADAVKTEPLHPATSKDGGPASESEVKGQEDKKEEAKGEEIKGEEAKSEETKSEETKSGEAKSDEEKSCEAKSEDAKGREDKKEDGSWDWGQRISGKVELSETPTIAPQAPPPQQVNTINVLSVRKKRNASVDVPKQSTQEGVTVLSAGLVRKKPRVEEEGKKEE